MSYFTQEVLVRNAELTSYHQTEEFGKGQEERGDASPCVLPTSQNSPCWNPSWLSNAHTPREDPLSEWLARDNREANPITIKPETVSHVAEQVLLGSLTLLPSTRVPIPNKAFWFVSTCVSLDSSFQRVRQEPIVRLWKGVPFLWQI